MHRHLHHGLAGVLHREPRSAARAERGIVQGCNQSRRQAAAHLQRLATVLLLLGPETGRRPGTGDKRNLVRLQSANSEPHRFFNNHNLHRRSHHIDELIYDDHVILNFIVLVIYDIYKNLHNLDYDVHGIFDDYHHVFVLLLRVAIALPGVYGYYGRAHGYRMATYLVTVAGGGPSFAFPERPSSHP